MKCCSPSVCLDFPLLSPKHFLVIPLTFFYSLGWQVLQDVLCDQSGVVGQGSALAAVFFGGRQVSVYALHSLQADVWCSVVLPCDLVIVHVAIEPFHPQQRCLDLRGGARDGVQGPTGAF